MEAVHLQVCSAETVAAEDASILFRFIAAQEDGVTRKSLWAKWPAGLTRARARAALEYLNDGERLVVREEPRGRNRQPTGVFFAPRPGLEVA